MIEQLVRQFLYHPSPIDRDTPLPRWAQDAREVWMRAEDGNDIHGLYWPPPIDERNPTTPRPTILFLHGNAQTVMEWAMVRDELAPAACGLLLIDYPGYGKSTGAPSEQSLYAAGRAALTWLAREQTTPAERVIVFGKSLGGGVATELAVSSPVLGVVLESTFCSIPAVVKRLIPFIPASMAFRTERYDSLARMEHITAPVLVIHGEKDTLIPVRQGRALYERANASRSLRVVAGAGHNDVSMTAGPEYGSWLRDWVDGVALASQDDDAGATPEPPA